MSVLSNYLSNNKENDWQKASATIDATAKIYGYRVDSVHSETFKFLGGLNRTEFKENDEENNSEGQDGIGEEKSKEKKVSVY